MLKKNKTVSLIFLFIFCVLSHSPAFAQRLNLDSLSEKDQKIVDSILIKTTPLIDQKKATGNVNLLTEKELFKSLNQKEKKWIKKMLRLRPSELGVKTPAQPHQENLAFHEVSNQKILKGGQPFTLPIQAVSEPAYAAYEKMMQAMITDIGKKLYIESAHRSPTYQLWLFIFYLKTEHHYSIRETGKLSALPGYSEHNLAIGHAIDLINGEGINGDPDFEKYEVLPEHQWMLKHAEEYGFTLSYPRNNPWGISFEPWHWRYAEINAQRRTNNAKEN